jgi:hypothetical protein
MDENKKGPSDEELEELMETIKKLEEERKKQGGKKPKRNLMVIEFGGVYHTNPFLDFIFSLLVNMSLALLLVELFGLASYENELSFIGFIFTYTVIETIVKYFMTMHLIQYIIKSFGFILFIAYTIIFYVVDQYIFTQELFNFKHELLMVAFVTLFVLIRYFVGTSIRRKLRSVR